MRLWQYIKKGIRDLALTLYDHPTEFQQMSLPRVWFTIIGVAYLITWVREEFLGIQFKSWTALTGALATCAGAYAFKKVSERNAPNNAIGAQGVGDRESN
jgi:hypothetical protein